jgi:hypothetical protein
MKNAVKNVSRGRSSRAVIFLGFSKHLPLME